MVTTDGLPRAVLTRRSLPEKNMTVSPLRTCRNMTRDENQQITLLGEVTFHDITNKLFMIFGYVDLVKHDVSDPVVAGYLSRIESAAKGIQSDIAGMKRYQIPKNRTPQWQDLGQTLERVQFPEGITLDLHMEDYEIYADPLLDRVFGNLLDNSLRHGMTVTKITLCSQRSPGGILIIWEDNGIGIPYEEKEIIFEEGVGKNTGLGLSLVQKILAITRIGIHETGIPGRGARFEILVPEGLFRCRLTEQNGEISRRTEQE